MQILELQAVIRQERGRGTNQLRRSGKLPAIVYGHGVTPHAVTLTASEFSRVHRATGESTLVDLRVDDAEPVKVLIKEVAHDPLTGNVIHVDFQQVNLTEEVQARIPLRFTGSAPAEKTGGIIVTQLDHIEVRALPTALVHEILVDLSPLAAIDDAIHVRDLPVPPGIRTLDDGGIIVVLVVAPSEEEVEVVAPAAETAVPVEGAAASDAAPAEEKKGEGKKTAEGKKAG